MMKVAALMLALASASAMELTPENFDDAVAGKTVFIKFLAPWCGHCKSMKPAWDSLMEEYKGHESKLIADVDCTAAGKPLCDSNGVKGFPTIKYGDPSDLQDYKGGRDLAALKAHAENKLVPMCSPSKLELCDDEKKGLIQKFQAMSAGDLEKLITAEGEKIKEAESTFEKSVKELQATYEGLQKAKEEAIEKVNSAGLGIMKAVKAAGGKKSGSGEL